MITLELDYNEALALKLALFNHGDHVRRMSEIATGDKDYLKQELCTLESIYYKLKEELEK